MTRTCALAFSPPAQGANRKGAGLSGALHEPERALRGESRHGQDLPRPAVRFVPDAARGASGGGCVRGDERERAGGGGARAAGCAGAGRGRGREAGDGPSRAARVPERGERSRFAGASLASLTLFALRAAAAAASIRSSGGTLPFHYLSQAGGGVIFVDEAYQLNPETDSSGRRVLDMILTHATSLEGPCGKARAEAGGAVRPPPLLSLRLCLHASCSSAPLPPAAHISHPHAYSHFFISPHTNACVRERR